MIKSHCCNILAAALVGYSFYNPQYLITKTNLSLNRMKNYDAFTIISLGLICINVWMVQIDILSNIFIFFYSLLYYDCIEYKVIFLSSIKLNFLRRIFAIFHRITFVWHLYQFSFLAFIIFFHVHECKRKPQSGSHCGTSYTIKIVGRDPDGIVIIADSTRKYVCAFALVHSYIFLLWILGMNYWFLLIL